MLEHLYRANLHLRTATRVLLRVAEFRARTFFELERHAKKIAWDEILPNDAPLALRVTSRKSKLYHEGAIAERFSSAISARAAVSQITTAASEEEGDETPQLLVVRFLRDACTVSLDASGALLHRRGYRQALAKAPLRENLAAALLDAAGWRKDAPLLDPMCGSGTIAIEAALRARRIAPGLASAERSPRAFAFQRWPLFQAHVWDTVVTEAREQIQPRAAARIHASDRDAGAIAAATANAERAGVADDISFAVRPLTQADAPDGVGWLVTHPPYGVRGGETRALRDLFAALGRLARDRLPGWTVALLSADPRLEAQTGLALREVLATRNGGIAVRVVVAEP